MVVLYAKFATEHLTAAVSRIEPEGVIELSRFCHSAPNEVTAHQMKTAPIAGSH
jgi:hypothetical protein